jgi:hypothetical protein
VLIGALLSGEALFDGCRKDVFVSDGFAGRVGCCVNVDNGALPAVSVRVLSTYRAQFHDSSSLGDRLSVAAQGIAT